MGSSVLTPPTCEPLHVNDVRQHLKQDITDDDNLIDIYLGSARIYAEDITRKQFVAARYVYKFDGFPTNYAGGLSLSYDINLPGNAILLPKAPVIEIESINYIDTGGNEQTVNPSDYVIDAISEPARITPIFGKIWPINRPQIGSVWVTYKAGYVAQAAFDPDTDTISIKNWRALAVNDSIRISNSGGLLPAGLNPKTDYVIKNIVDAGIYQLAVSANSAVINIADPGTGTHFIGQPGINFSQGEIPPAIKAWMLIRCDTHYSHRGENVNTRRGEIKALPYTDRLLDNDRLW